MFEDLGKKYVELMSRERKQARNLFRALTKNENSAPYDENDLTKNLTKKAKKSNYEKDCAFVKILLIVKNKNTMDRENSAPLTTKFPEQKKDIDQHSTLYSFDGQFQLFYADFANLEFLAKSAVDRKYFLLFVNLFKSKVYIYPIKNRRLLAQNMKLLYKDAEVKRKDGKMRLQMD